MCKNIHNSTIANSQNVETSQMSISWWMDRQNLLCPYNEIKFENKKKWNTDTSYNSDEPWKHAVWKKPDTKNHILYGSIYVKYSEEACLQRQKVDYRAWGMKKLGNVN